MYPIRLDVNSAISLLQEQNIAGDFRARVGFESVIGQANSAQQFRAPGDVLTHFGALFVHRAFG